MDEIWSRYHHNCWVYSFPVQHAAFFFSSLSFEQNTRSITSGNTSMRWRGHTMRRMSLFPGAEPAPLAAAEDALQKEMENGKKVSTRFATCVINREIIVSNLMCDRGAKPGQGTGCHVNARTVSRHPGTANELWREKIYQVGWTDCWRRYAFSLVLLSPCCWPSHTPLMTIKVRFQGAFHRTEMKTN